MDWSSGFLISLQVQHFKEWLVRHYSIMPKVMQHFVTAGNIRPNVESVAKQEDEYSGHSLTNTSASPKKGARHDTPQQILQRSHVAI